MRQKIVSRIGLASLALMPLTIFCAMSQALAEAAETTQMTGKCICSTPLVESRQDIAELRWAAEQGDADAQRDLGLKHEKGNGAPQDDNQAVDWYRKAAAQGDAKAQWFLGGMHEEGKGVPQDSKQALFWYGRAAEQGSLNAQVRLGEIFAEGIAVRQNLVVAYAWYSLAYAQGEEIASRKRAVIASKFTTEQLSQAQALAAELQSKIDSE